MVVRPPTRVYGFGRILQNVQTVTFFPKKGVCYAFSDRRIIYNYVCPGCLADLPKVNISVLKFGTVNWELTQSKD